MPRPDGALYVYSGGQGVWDDRNQIASVLGIDPSMVTVELVSNGGAFGGKEDMSNQAQTALAAHLLGKPVKCTLSREESLLLHPKRHPIRMDYTAGCDDDGRLTALLIRMIGDSGPYASVGMKVLERAAGHASGPYSVPNIDVESVAARTNNPVCGAFRGFGANQAQFAMEGVMDRLAAEVGIDGWEMRSRNVVVPGSVWGPGQIMDEGCVGRPGVPRRREAHLRRRPGRRAARGHRPGAQELGSRQRPAGGGQGGRALRARRHRGGAPLLDRDGPGRAHRGPAGGRHRTGRGRREGEASSSTPPGSWAPGRPPAAGAPSWAPARWPTPAGWRWPTAAGRAWTTRASYVVDWTNSLRDDVENPTIHSCFGFACQLVELDPDSGDVSRVLAAHDVGKAVNPTLCEGQIEGSVHMGLGYALTEGFPSDAEGRPLNATLAQPGHRAAQGHAGRWT